MRTPRKKREPTPKFSSLSEMAQQILAHVVFGWQEYNGGVGFRYLEKTFGGNGLTDQYDDFIAALDELIAKKLLDIDESYFYYYPTQIGEVVAGPFADHFAEI
jgi:hypothetical protein